MRTLAVFCGSLVGNRAVYAEAAAALANELASRDMQLVYGGGGVGIMGLLADAAMARGVPVVGVIPAHLEEKEVGHRGLTRLEVVPSMHARKARMAELADGFVALPGGVGTLEELFEVYTWGLLGLHQKPVAVLDVAGLWAPLLRAVDHLVDEGFVRPVDGRRLIRGTEPGALLDAMEAWTAPADIKWMKRAEEV
ncbi:MAG: TIGR00730 family Rossman fold protein [Myxococcales bacterium]|nr:TIGR00730 family Rossman fold protein [Myxococcales bacterium]